MYQLKRIYKEPVSEGELARVRSFDKEYKLLNDYMFLMYKVITYLLAFCGTLLWMIPIQDERLHPVFGITVFMQIVACFCYIRPYLKCNMDGSVVSIQEILSATPVSRQAVIKVRLSYLKQYNLKAGSAALLMQQLGAILNGKWAISNLFYPALSVCIVYILMAAFVKSSCRA